MVSGKVNTAVKVTDSASQNIIKWDQYIDVLCTAYLIKDTALLNAETTEKYRSRLLDQIFVGKKIILE